MKLELGGIDTEVTNLSDIALMKRRGWVEVKKEPKEEPQKEGKDNETPKDKGGKK
jgi:hypothetical protein